jgi:hypothetical protein
MDKWSSLYVDWTLLVYVALLDYFIKQVSFKKITVGLLILTGHTHLMNYDIIQSGCQ